MPFAVLLRTLLVTLAAFALGCDRDIGPPLIDVTEVTPRAVELGDRLEIRGAGFPQGRPARVVFRGQLHRPGKPATRAEIVTEAVASSSERVEIAIDDAIEAELCGRGEHADHTTLRGEIEVGFASRSPGAPPVVGILRDVTLDVTPGAVRASVTAARRTEGARVLAFLGVTAGAPSARGLPVESVTAGSPADVSGITTGDTLVSVDGVNLQSTSDVIPASARSAKIGVRREGDTTVETKTVTMAGYATGRISTELAPALLVVGVALMLLLVLVLPTPALASEIELRAAMRMRREGARGALKALFGHGPSAIASAMASVLVVAMALAPQLVARELDAGLLLACAIALIAASRVARARGVRAWLAAIGDVAAAFVLLVAVTAAAMTHAGAIGLGELVRAQGALPWEFTAARGPVGALLAAVHLGTLVALARRVEPRVIAGARSVAACSAAPGAPPSARILERLGLILGCALAVALYFGGPQVPGDGAHRALTSAAGGAVFLVKVWATFAFVLASSSLASPWTEREARAFLARRLLPTTLVAGALLFVTRRFGTSESLDAAFGAAVVTSAALLAAKSAIRVRFALRAPEPHASPFL